jgi:ABC-2 type transport system ATP-binding protein
VTAIEVRGLVKQYGDTTAVDGLDLEIADGQVFALLGPNGAGKTTTVEILEGHRRRDSGSVSVLGFDPEGDERAFRERIGIVLQESGIEQILTVTEAIDLYGGVYPRRRPTGELIELVGLEEKADARIKTLSGGQQRRLELALGLVGDPDLLFLDEPTTGFDPSARRQAWTIVENLTHLGKTVLLTTHYMDEAQYLADEIAVIAQGRIVAQAAPDELVRRSTGQAVISFTIPADVPLADLPATPSHRNGETIEFSSDAPTRLVHELTGWAIRHDLELDHLTISRPSLEDVYLELTKAEADE